MFDRTVSLRHPLDVPADPEIAITDAEGNPEMLLGSIAGKEPLTDESIRWDPRF